ncbi:MAG TPA: lantibiotic dehydratase C-terminal domain-containing protein [Thermoanaerobaculia bacterium]|nr:lantibiotic dehydratase C-terminal domain-containing protein [Thermoanaerobaculia bacterium]
MADSEAVFPDPVVTANVYCHHRQDEVIHGTLAPLRREMAETAPQGLGHLWFVRYPRRGEHLKVRIHGPAEAAPRLREMLARSVEDAFARLAPSETGERKEARELPPLDAEDAAEGLQPDRSLLWTRYQRSHITLGGKPLLDDDRYAALFTTALAYGCDAVLAALRPNAEGRFPQGQRQAALFKLALGGLAAAGYSPSRSAAYLAYHRDWLLRFATGRANAGAEKVRELLAQFDQRAETMAAALDPLRLAAAATLGGEMTDALDPSDSRWRSAMGVLTGYVSRFRDDPSYQLDPFTDDVVFSPLFKVFHGVANQLGLNMLNEALTHHLLLQAVAA